MYALEKTKLPLMYTMYVNASINNPSHTCISLYIVFKVHPKGIICHVHFEGSKLDA